MASSFHERNENFVPSSALRKRVKAIRLDELTIARVEHVAVTRRKNPAETYRTLLDFALDTLDVPVASSDLVRLKKERTPRVGSSPAPAPAAHVPPNPAYPRRTVEEVLGISGYDSSDPGYAPDPEPEPEPEPEELTACPKCGEGDPFFVYFPDTKNWSCQNPTCGG